MPWHQSKIFRTNRRAVGADSGRADPVLFTLLDPTMPPTSFDIGFSLNPCPRKLGAPHVHPTGRTRQVPLKQRQDRLEVGGRDVDGGVYSHDVPLIV